MPLLYMHCNRVYEIQQFDTFECFLELDLETSKKVFERTGEISQIIVALVK